MTDVGWPDEQPSLGDGVVTLRPIRPADRAAVHRACQDPQLQRWTLVPVPYLPEHADELVGPETHEQYKERRGAHFAVTWADRSHEPLDGVIGVKSVDTVNRTAEIGFWLGEWARNRGMATRALTLLSEWMERDVGVGRLEAYVHTDNVASWKALEKAGYQREGLLRRKFNVRGEWPDMYLYARLR